MEQFVGHDSKDRINNKNTGPTVNNHGSNILSKDKSKLVRKLGKGSAQLHQADNYEEAQESLKSDAMLIGASRQVNDFNQRLAEQQPVSQDTGTELHDSSREETSQLKDLENVLTKERSSGVVQNAFDRMRPRRRDPEVATITIGSKTTTSVLGASYSSKRRKIDSKSSTPDNSTPFTDDTAMHKFSSSMRAFAAPGFELIKSVGKPQSMSHISRPYLDSASDSDEKPAIRDLSPTLFTPVNERNDKDQQSGTSEIEEESSADEDQTSFRMGADSDHEYLDDDMKRAEEEIRVSELIKQAEQTGITPSEESVRRADQMMRGRGRKDSTTQLMQMLEASVERIDQHLQITDTALHREFEENNIPKPTAPPDDTSPEERLSLTVSKADFTSLKIIGQFNLGFILVIRGPCPSSPESDLFIIDQHASDEKYNFERLQATTVVQNQRLVRPHKLELTAIEEEIIIENNDALLKNGFLVDVNTCGEEPVGRRCKLRSLPMSREVTFDITDLEELIALLTDSPSPSSSKIVPRPSKVRRMFAMRACRSSVMIGKTLNLKQMGALVKRMGEIDKPWNCPHGRPTMRHVCGLGDWEEWKEGDGLVGMEEEMERVDWGGWIERRRELQGSEQGVGPEQEETGQSFDE